MKPNELQKRLQDIGLAMSDGYMFLEVRFFLEGLNTQAENGDESAKKIMQIVDQFGQLVEIAAGRKN